MKGDIWQALAGLGGHFGRGVDADHIVAEFMQVDGVAAGPAGRLQRRADRQCTDTHGASTVGFAFAHMLDFKLQPWLKNIGSAKLYRPAVGEDENLPTLAPVLSMKTIDWDLIAQQYDQIVKYTTALRLGTAEAEQVLRRFTRGGPKHPTCWASEDQHPSGTAGPGGPEVGGQAHRRGPPGPVTAVLDACESVRMVRLDMNSRLGPGRGQGTDEPQPAASR
ncbi:Tn3 family transposase [Streptomyces sp. NPDC046915]|uniref:Tn3 family transposase n=1 Tax=Streptomyces sp. NPDC046915 TaxID=3155257 RepID=UPI0033CBCE6D